ncbi:MAG TPA: DUF2071 domain-containing protein [Vicinamibacterales bacterium]|nr:DUF2071 domain-containing protein [Vicinamibacterales bacterium]
MVGRSRAPAAARLVVMVQPDRHPASPPDGPWVMVQRWHDLLFAHWRCSIADLRALIPAPLEIETFDGSAWISVIPFYMTGVRMRAAPPVPTAHAFEELNVRTYVTLDGRPGIWFFSLDCTSMLAVIGARIGIYLPYFRATMAMSTVDGTITYRSDRWSIGGATPASFAGTYRAVGHAEHPAPGTLEHFLAERYSLYASSRKRIWRGDIYHPRWSLQHAEANIDRNSMITAAGVRVVEGGPVLHFGKFQDVRFWWPVRVR